MYVYCVHAYCLWKPNKVSYPLELVLDSCELPWRLWKFNQGPLQRNPGLLITEPSPVPTTILYINNTLAANYISHSIYAHTYIYLQWNLMRNFRKKICTYWYWQMPKTHHKIKSQLKQHKFGCNSFLNKVKDTNSFLRVVWIAKTWHSGHFVQINGEAE